MEASVFVINSFSIDSTGGNPAGVVLDADNLSNSQKQLIAKKGGLSETAFVSKSEIADFKFDFFTPTKQIAHCGHATIAAFSYLKSIGRIGSDTSSKETIDGVRKIFFRGTEAYMEQVAPKFTELDSLGEVLESIGVNPSLLHKNFRPIIGNTGNSFLLIGLAKESFLQSLSPKQESISRISEKLGCIGYYVFAFSDDGSSIQTRMFAPFYGINEESATGMAAGPLAALLYDSLKRNSLSITQGKYMSPSSESELKADLSIRDGRVDSLLVGGSAYVKETINVVI
jgi:PhzF family phenazine biosynthesis protein